MLYFQRKRFKMNVAFKLHFRKVHKFVKKACILPSFVKEGCSLFITWCLSVYFFSKIRPFSHIRTCMYVYVHSIAVVQKVYDVYKAYCVWPSQELEPFFSNSPCFFLEIAYSVQAYRRITICFILCQPLTLNYPPCCFLPWNPNIYSSSSVSFLTEHTEGRKGVLHLKNVPSIFANQDYYLEIFVCFFREYIPSISGCHASRFRQNEQILFLFSFRARGKGPFVLGNTHTY